MNVLKGYEAPKVAQCLLKGGGLLSVNVVDDFFVFRRHEIFCFAVGPVYGYVEACCVLSSNSFLLGFSCCCCCCCSCCCLLVVVVKTNVQMVV